MNEEMMELLMQRAMELMEPTRTRLREQNPVFEEGRSVCGELEKKFDEAVEALRNVNAEMADLFVLRLVRHQYLNDNQLFVLGHYLQNVPKWRLVILLLYE